MALPLQAQGKCFTSFLQSPGIPWLPDYPRAFDLIRAVPLLPENILNENNILGAMKELLKKRDGMGRRETVTRRPCQVTKKE